MKIAYICQYFVPEIGAPSARVSELSREWAAGGHDVTVITGLPNHPTGIVPREYRGVVFRRERLGAVAVWRNWLFATPNEGFIKKTLSHLSFMCSVLLLSGPRMGDFDMIVVSSPTFFVVLSAYLISALQRVPFVFEVRDLWPSIFVELGVLKQPLLIKMLEAIEMFLYRKAARVVVVTESFANILVRRGVPTSKVLTITNGVDAAVFQPGAHENDVCREHRLEGRFVVLYIGAHGISQGVAAILEVARLASSDRNIIFAFVGEGAEKAKLVARAAELGLSNVLFVSGQPKDRVVEWYAAADVVLVPLRDVPLFETFIPSKMFEIMAAGRPIVASLRGEARCILERSGGALVVDPEDSRAIADAVFRLRDSPELRTRLGENGRNFVIEHYSRARLAREYIAALSAARAEARALIYDNF